MREGSLEAPVRHKIDWQNPDFYDKGKLDAEMHRAFEICHGCRRCFNLCDSFPRLFDLVDASPDEVAGVHVAGALLIVPDPNHRYAALGQQQRASRRSREADAEGAVAVLHRVVNHRNGEGLARDTVGEDEPARAVGIIMQGG